MTGDGNGWFRAPVDLGPGARYAFALDGGPPRPDPRSHRQPEGVDGPSAVVDHDSFSWTDGYWRGIHLPSCVLYELHVGTFTPEGTFDAAVGRLERVADLGVDAVEVMPVAAFDGDRGWGYDGVGLYATHEPYGGPDAFKRFVDAAHGHGLGVLLDVVYNHLGPTGNHLGRFGPYFTDNHTTPWGDAVNLDDEGSHEVRRFLRGNARHWLERFHLDGLRLDAVHFLKDDSPVHFLAELSEGVEALSAHVRRPLWLVAEHGETEPAVVTPRPAGGHGLDAQWRDEVHHAIHAAMTGERDGWYEPYGTVAAIADELTGPGAGVPRSAFITCTQNHDQIGNRAAGERLEHLVGTDLAMLAAALVVLGPGVPMLFMGEEWAASTPFPYFCGPRDPGLDDAVREGRRREFAAFGWSPAAVPDPLAGATFESAKLRWDELADSHHAGVRDWYRRLIELRRRHRAVTDPRPGSVAVVVDEDRQRLVMTRGDVEVRADLDNGTCTVVVGDDVFEPPRSAKGARRSPASAPR